MLKIGESLNSSIPKTLALLEPFDEEGVRGLISAQKNCGATVLDLNTALTSDELGLMRRLADLAAEEGGLIPMFDSPDSNVLIQMLESTTGEAYLNSVTLTEREDVLPIVARQIAEGRALSVVALPVGDALPITSEERNENARLLIEKIKAAGIPEERILLDLLIETVATDSAAAVRVFDTLDYVKQNHPKVRTVCGLSNVSFGLPMRADLNAAFVAMLCARGLDGAILNVTSPKMRVALAACELFCGEDDYCMKYLSLYRELNG